MCRRAVVEFRHIMCPARCRTYDCQFDARCMRLNDKGQYRDFNAALNVVKTRIEDMRLSRTALADMALQSLYPLSSYQFGGIPSRRIIRGYIWHTTLLLLGM